MSRASKTYVLFKTHIQYHLTSSKFVFIFIIFNIEETIKLNTAEDHR